MRIPAFILGDALMGDRFLLVVAERGHLRSCRGQLSGSEVNLTPPGGREILCPMMNPTAQPIFGGRVAS